jgi:hypothetical protein
VTVRVEIDFEVALALPAIAALNFLFAAIVSPSSFYRDFSTFFTKNITIKIKWKKKLTFKRR